MKQLSYLSNSLWKLISKGRFDKFIKSSKNVLLTQEKYLLELLKKNQNTSYGKRYEFKKIKFVKEFQNKIPVTEYEDYTHHLEQIRSGKKNILSSDPFQRFTLTSGTTSSSKWIPYNSTLKKEFQKSLSVWIYNLFQDYPEIMKGNAYWVVSPILDKQKYDSKIPVGFEADTAYLGFFEQYIVNSIQSVPSMVSKISNFEDFKYVTLLFLLSDPELRLISVWSPSYLKILLSYFNENSDSIIKDIEFGKISIKIEKKIKEALQSKLTKNSERAEYLREISKKGIFSWEKVWTKLTLISLWTEGNSQYFLPEIKKLFPNTKIQGKGLLATEGLVTFPFNFGNFSGNVLGINSHFYEFRDVQTGAILLANQLNKESIYEVIITTGGGLYRYATKDRVKVTGFYNEVPAFLFMGKEETVSDLVGEKLSEMFLNQVLTDQFEKFKINPEFYYVKPTIHKGVGNYTLYLETLSQYNKEKLAELIDTNLMDNLYYAHARQIGQLTKFKVKPLPNDSMKEYFQAKSKYAPLGTAKRTLFQNKTLEGE